MSRRYAFLLVAIAFAALTVAMAEDAIVKVIVREPDQAYVFVDGQPVGLGTRVLKLTPGDHSIGVYNYGFSPEVRKVTLAAGKKNDIQEFYLKPAGGPVSGPWGVLQIEGAPEAAVFLNGKQPEYIVGQLDELNNHVIWKQQLIVPAGRHEVTVREKDKDIWSGNVEVPANKRVIVYTDQDGKTVVKDWNRGEKMQATHRFEGGLASTRVIVAPVTGTFAASPKQMDCNEKVNLAWNTTETLHRAITSDSENFAEVPMNGQETVSPRKTTTYQFKASGPGGIVEGIDTVKVNPIVQATLTPSPEDVHYLRIGDKVIVQDHATLSWNVRNADNIALEPLGTVGTSGSKTVEPTPKVSATGPVNETHIYKLAATNVCGGSETKTATVRLVGEIVPTVSSVFFPTGYPDRGHPNKGLLNSQKEQLARIAAVFKLYMEHTPNAVLDITGFADTRGAQKANKILSARRAMIVREFLASQGIPTDRLAVQVKGAAAPLDANTVALLEERNPAPAQANRFENAKATQLAYDRRVDVTIQPAAVESARFFPHAASDSALLYDPHWLAEKQIHQAGH